MRIANARQPFFFLRGQFIRRVISAAFLDKGERTVIYYEMVRKELLGRSETLGKEPPETLPADFHPAAIKTLHWASRMFESRAVDGGLDSHPIAHRGNLAKGHAGLRHAKRSRVHSQKDDFFPRCPKTPQVYLVGFPRINERVIDVNDRLGEAKGPGLDRQFTRRRHKLMLQRLRHPRKVPPRRPNNKLLKRA